ncbi:MAG: hypothetical protein WEB19_00955, partial [Acidimicrobiia bacterium]
MPSRYVLNASAGVEILQRTGPGQVLAEHLRAQPVELWTAEHFHVEVAKVFRRDVLSYNQKLWIAGLFGGAAY